MKKKDFQCWVILAIAVGLAAVGVLIWQWPTPSIEWAAWAQAVGSVAAIFAAICIGRSQSEASREMLREQWEREEQIVQHERVSLLRSKAQIAERVAQSAMHACGAITGVLQSYEQEACTRSATLSEGLSTLESMRLDSVPEVFIALDVMNLRLSLRRLIAELGDVASGGDPQERRDEFERLHKRVEDLKKTISKTADAYKGDWPVVRAVDL